MNISKKEPFFLVQTNGEMRQLISDVNIKELKKLIIQFRDSQNPKDLHDFGEEEHELEFSITCN